MGVFHDKPSNARSLGVSQAGPWKGFSCQVDSPFVIRLVSSYKDGTNKDHWTIWFYSLDLDAGCWIYLYLVGGWKWLLEAELANFIIELEKTDENHPSSEHEKTIHSLTFLKATQQAVLNLRVRLLLGEAFIRPWKLDLTGPGFTMAGNWRSLWKMEEIWRLVAAKITSTWHEWVIFLSSLTGLDFSASWWHRNQRPGLRRGFTGCHRDGAMEEENHAPCNGQHQL